MTIGEFDELNVKLRRWLEWVRVMRVSALYARNVRDEACVTFAFWEVV